MQPRQIMTSPIVTVRPDVEVTDGTVELLGHFDDADGRAALALARTVPGVLAAHLAGARTLA